MGFRITNTFKSYPGIPKKIERKGEDERPGGRQNEHQQEEKKEEKKPLRFEDLKKAVDDESQRLESSGSDLKIEMITGESGTIVRITDATGHLVRELNAEQYMDLQKTSQQDLTHRGKILDQKY